MEAARIRLCEHILEQAAHGARTVESSLWASEHFDTLDVIGQQVKCEVGVTRIAGAATYRCVVDIGSYSGPRPQGRHATDNDGGLTWCASGDHLEARNIARHIRQLRNM